MLRLRKRQIHPLRYRTRCERGEEDGQDAEREGGRVVGGRGGGGGGGPVQDDG